MTTRRAVFELPGGGTIGIVCPSPRAYGLKIAAGKTDEVAFAEIVVASVPIGAGRRVDCDASVLPADRTKRNEWRLSLDGRKIEDALGNVVATIG